MSLSKPLKEKIQQHYREYLQARDLSPRLGQKQMIANIANQLGNIKQDADNKRTGGEHIAVVEAGTGTGKTVAYLLGALPIAKAFNKRLVIATATVALQEQVIYKDLPDIKKNTSLAFRYGLAKGRGRYLCLTKIDRLLSEGLTPVSPPLYEDEYPTADEQSLPLYQSMVEALAANKWDGDKDAWPEELTPEQWQPITTNHQQCTGRRCANVSACSFFKARESLDNVDCIVANHDLVLADLALGGGAILPEPADTIYIFDEGHHLPDKALNHFAYHSRLLSTAKFFEQGPGLLEKLLEALSPLYTLAAHAQQAPALMNQARANIEQLHTLCQPFLDELPENDDRKRHRFTHGEVPDAIVNITEELATILTKLSDCLANMIAELESEMEESFAAIAKHDCETWYGVLGQWQGRVQANASLFLSYCQEDKKVPTARWLTLIDSGSNLDVEMCSSPIIATSHLQDSLWQECFAAIVTSATLTALNSFDRFQMRAGVDASHHFSVVPSPFDSTRARLCVPQATVEGNQAVAHTESVIELLPGLLQQQKGALVLFASRKQMHQVFEALDEPWQEKIIIQGDRSKQAMLTEHKKNIDAGHTSVLFGLASFAEGVDLPGQYCEHVIIAKLPFAVPDDPIEAALAEWFETQGRNPFMDITVPDAAMKLVQACGRLLRTETDQGQITLLDKRLLTKRYGQVLLKALPAYEFVSG